MKRLLANKLLKEFYISNLPFDPFMPKQRQPFRFRLPWLAAPKPASAAPRPNQATKAPSQPKQASRPRQGAQAPSQPAGSQIQRPPFRPAGVAPAKPSPPSTPSIRVEPSSSSQSSQGLSKLAEQAQETKLSQGPPASPLQTVPQIKATPRSASPAQVSSIPQTTKALPQSPSQSGRVTKLPTPKTIEAPPPTSQANIPSPKKKPPTITSQISQNPNEDKERETSRPPSEELRADLEELKTRAPIKLAANDSCPNQEPKPSVEELYETSYRKPKQVLNSTYDRLTKDASDKEVTSSNTQTEIHHEQGQQSEEEVFDIKKVIQKFENEGGIHDYRERVGKTGVQKATFHKEVEENMPKSVHEQGSQGDRILSNEKPCCIVTLSGENTGAIMHNSSESQRKKRPVYIHRGYKIKSRQVVENITVDNQGSYSKRKPEDKNIQEELETKLYVNNNTQGINNSFVFNRTIAEKNPGVDLVLSWSPIEPVKQRKERQMLDAHKVEVTRTPAERLAYVPTIKRKCC